MLNGLDLFSGIGGLTIALQAWVKPIAYCECERYAQAVLLQQMCNGKLPIAPIWDDIRTLRGEHLPEIDIIYGGFPCQDISVAGTRKGLEGKRSGLFSEIMRLSDEIKPPLLFLENVPNIRTNGLEEIVREITNRGYDCRWHTLPASEVGTIHKRNRWWLLAYSKHVRSSKAQALRGDAKTIPNDTKRPDQARKSQGIYTQGMSPSGYGIRSQKNAILKPVLDRYDHDVPCRMDRIRCMANAVVPAQAKKAFEILMGLL